MNFIGNLLNILNTNEAEDIILDINDRLLNMQENNLLSDPERDALRHYFGTGALVDKYGETLSWLLGRYNEGFDPIWPDDEVRIQSHYDIVNNNIAFDHIKKGSIVSLEDIFSHVRDIDRLRGGMSAYEQNKLLRGEIEKVLNFLEIPPPYEFTQDTGAGEQATVSGTNNVQY